MKKITKLLFFLVATTYMKAENHLTNNTMWTEYEINTEGVPYVTYKVQSKLLGDTIIQEKDYQKLYYNNSYLGAFRELENKVYFILSENQESGIYLDITPNVEYLLYDFSAKEGDTIRNILIGGMVTDVKITKTDSITIENGTQRKRMFLENDHTWIEGIGNTKGVLTQIQPEATDIDCINATKNQDKNAVQRSTTCINPEIHKLVCFKQKGEVLYSDPNYCFGDCCTFDGLAQSVQTVQMPDDDMDIQITSNSLEISLFDKTIETIQLLQLNGIVERSHSFEPSNNAVLNTSGLPHGIYLIHLRSTDTVYSKKVVL